jgi:magnesium transporter
VTDGNSPVAVLDDPRSPAPKSGPETIRESGATVAGGVSGVGGVPETLQDVIEVEGAARDAPDAPSSVRAYLFHSDEAVREVALSEVAGLLPSEENFVWVDLSGFGEADLRRVADVLGLSRALVHAALSPWQRPRIDVYGEVFFVTATVPRTDDEAYRVYAAELDLFVGHNFLVGAHKRPLPFHDRAMARAEQNPGLMQEDSSFLLYIVLDELLDYYEGLVEGMNDQIERMEERALTDTSDDYLGDLLHLKRYVYALGRIAQQHREVLVAFTRPDFPFTSREEMEPYFRDLENRHAQLIDTLDRARDAVNGAFDIYVSHVSHRMNRVMQVLTVVSATLLPTTVILGFWGTSVEGLPLYTPAGFLLMVAVIALTTIGSLTVFRRKGWL